MIRSNPASRIIIRLWDSATFTTWASMAARLAALVVVLPIVLVRFTPSDVAVWQLFATVSTLVLMFDFGLAPTLARMIAYADGGASIDDMRDLRKQPLRKPCNGTAAQTAAEISASLRWLYPRIGLIAIALAASLGTLAMRRPIEASTAPFHTWIAWSAVLVGAYVSLAGASYAAILQGYGSIAPLRRLEAAAGIAQVLSALAVLMLGGNLLALVLSYQVWLVLNIFRNRWLLGRLHAPALSLRSKRDTRVLRTLWPAAWRSGTGVFFSQGIIQLSGLAYSQVAAPTAVASYLLGLRAITTISQFAQAPFYSKLPALAKLYIQGQREDLVSIAKRSMRVSHWVFVLGAGCAALSVPYLLSAIDSNTPFVQPRMWGFICLAFFVERYGAMHLQLYSLTNHILWHVVTGVTGCLMIGMSVVLLPLVGEIGMPLAMLGAYSAFYAVFSARHSSRAFNLSLWSYERTTSIAPALTLLFVFCAQTAYLGR